MGGGAVGSWGCGGPPTWLCVPVERTQGLGRRVAIVVQLVRVGPPGIAGRRPRGEGNLARGAMNGALRRRLRLLWGTDWPARARLSACRAFAAACLQAALRGHPVSVPVPTLPARSALRVPGGAAGAARVDVDSVFLLAPGGSWSSTLPDPAVPEFLLVGPNRWVSWVSWGAEVSGMKFWFWKHLAEAARGGSVPSPSRGP